MTTTWVNASIRCTACGHVDKRPVAVEVAGDQITGFADPDPAVFGADGGIVVCPGCRLVLNLDAKDLEPPTGCRGVKRRRAYPGRRLTIRGKPANDD